MTDGRASRAQRLNADRWRPVAHRRLDRLLKTSERLTVDDSSRIVFLSDCHRGDGGPTDDLWPNRHLYLDVLTHYHRQGFTCIEVGDGDELWKNRGLAPIRRAHRLVYDLLHEYHQQGRLHLLMGNHDYAGPRLRPISKEGIPAREGLVLQHNETGQEMLVTHGHQADFEHDPGLLFSRLGVRVFWRGLQQRGYWRSPNWAEMVRGRSWLGRVIARRMLDRNAIVKARHLSWVARSPAVGGGAALLCGHTHVASFPAPGTPAYLNTGCCIVPGRVTGLQLEDGQFSLVQWANHKGLKRELLAPSRPLIDLL